MSVKKMDKNVDQATEKASIVDPVALAELAGKMRQLLQYHQDLGLTTYPLSPELTHFLAGKKRKEGFIPPRFTTPKKTGKQHPRSPAADVPVSTALQDIHREMEECILCGLAGSRQGLVAGRGGERPVLMVVGSWSLQESGFSGEVLFSSQEDAMLMKMMQAIGLDPQDVYVTNCVKCCPSPGQTPEKAEEQRCFSYLIREIAIIRPRLICAMGETATSLLLNRSDPLVRLRGRFYQYRYANDKEALVMPTFHPRFLLAHPEMKKATWKDLQMIQLRLIEE